MKNFTNKTLFSSIKHRIYFLIFLGLVSKTLQAQSYNHTTLWSRVLVSKQINAKWFVSAENMLRRQNNFQNSKYNLLENKLLDAQRIVVAYRINKWQFAFAPSRWHAYQIIGKPEDLERKPTTEWRFTPTVEFFQPIKKGNLSWRTQYEYRYFADRTTGRFRQRFQYRWAVNQKNDLLVGNEFLWGAFPNSSKRFEQNQLNFLWFPKIAKHLEAEFGYRYVFRRRRNSDETDNENALVAGVFVRL